MSQNVLLISVQMLKDKTAAHTNIDEKLLFPTIKVCQDMYVHPILGSALFNKIITDVDAGTIAGLYKDLLDDYIIDALVWLVMSEAIFDTTNQLWNKGMVKKVGDSTETLSIDELEAMRNRYRIRGEWYLERCKNYLQATATSAILPEYLNGNDLISDISPEQRAFTMPVYLGEDYEEKCCKKYVP